MGKAFFRKLFDSDNPYSGEVWANIAEAMKRM